MRLSRFPLGCALAFMLAACVASEPGPDTEGFADPSDPFADKSGTSRSLDFFYGSRASLSGTWELLRVGPTAHSPGQGDRMTLNVPHTNDPNVITHGTIELPLPCDTDGTFQAPPENTAGAVLGAFTNAIAALRLATCASNDFTEERRLDTSFFPYAAKRRLLQHQSLPSACNLEGDGPHSVMYFEMTIGRNFTDALDTTTVLGCARLTDVDGRRYLALRFADPSAPAEPPTPWGVFGRVGESSRTGGESRRAEPNWPTCERCVGAGLGRDCISVCHGLDCRDCLSNRGGTGCITACGSDACTSCLTGGGGEGCVRTDRCKVEHLGSACITCVEGGGGSGCNPKCERR